MIIAGRDFDKRIFYKHMRRELNWAAVCIESISRRANKKERFRPLLRRNCLGIPSRIDTVLEKTEIQQEIGRWLAFASDH